MNANTALMPADRVKRNEVAAGVFQSHALASVDDSAIESPHDRLVLIDSDDIIGGGFAKTKGYKARNGRICGFIGVSAPYKEHTVGELTVEPEAQTEEQSLGILHQYVDRYLGPCALDNDQGKLRILWQNRCNIFRLPQTLEPIRE